MCFCVRYVSSVLVYTSNATEKQAMDDTWLAHGETRGSERKNSKYTVPLFSPPVGAWDLAR